MDIFIPEELKPLEDDLRRFFDAMVYKLRKNTRKGRWEDMDIRTTLMRMNEEVHELELAMKEGSSMEIILESADVANFAMILANIAIERGTEPAPKPVSASRESYLDRIRAHVAGSPVAAVRDASPVNDEAEQQIVEGPVMRAIRETMAEGTVRLPTADELYFNSAAYKKAVADLPPAEQGNLWDLPDYQQRIADVNGTGEVQGPSLHSTLINAK
jgi:hypothetical protein